MRLPVIMIVSKVPVVWAVQWECESVYISRFKHFWAINYSKFPSWSNDFAIDSWNAGFICKRDQILVFTVHSSTDTLIYLIA